MQFWHCLCKTCSTWCSGKMSISGRKAVMGDSQGLQRSQTFCSGIFSPLKNSGVVIKSLMDGWRYYFPDFHCFKLLALAGNATHNTFAVSEVKVWVLHTLPAAPVWAQMSSVSVEHINLWRSFWSWSFSSLTTKLSPTCGKVRWDQEWCLFVSETLRLCRGWLWSPSAIESKCLFY